MWIKIGYIVNFFKMFCRRAKTRKCQGKHVQDIYNPDKIL